MVSTINLFARTAAAEILGCSLADLVLRQQLACGPLIPAATCLGIDGSRRLPLCRCGLWMGSINPWKRQAEATASSQGGFHADRTPMASRNGLGNRQPQATASLLAGAGRLHTGKAIKDALLFTRRLSSDSTPTALAEAIQAAISRLTWAAAAVSPKSSSTSTQ